MKLKKIRETAKVEISNISVDEKYYSFDYKVWRNGALVSVGNYENDYSVPKQELIDDLENGYAVNIAMVQAFE